MDHRLELEFCLSSVSVPGGHAAMLVWLWPERLEGCFVVKV